MIYDIPLVGPLELKTIILDLNGTLTVRGKLVDGITERLARLRDLDYRIVLFTGNTRGDAEEIASKLGIDWVQVKDGEGKKQEALKLEPQTCVSIGNGLVDLQLMQTVNLRIATLQAEGVHVQTLLSCDVVVPTVNDALDMLIDPNTLIATIRK